MEKYSKQREEIIEVLKEELVEEPVVEAAVAEEAPKAE